MLVLLESLVQRSCSTLNTYVPLARLHVCRAAALRAVDTNTHRKAEPDGITQLQDLELMSAAQTTFTSTADPYSNPDRNRKPNPNPTPIPAC